MFCFLIHNLNHTELRTEFYGDVDVDSEYSPVCSDIEDELLASSGDAASTSSSSAPTGGSFSQNSEIMRLLDECSRAESVLDDAHETDDDEMEIG